jgi:hypothetical protein
MARANFCGEDRCWKEAPPAIRATNGGWSTICHDLAKGGCFALTNFTADEPSSKADGAIAFEVSDLDAQAQLGR